MHGGKEYKRTNGVVEGKSTRELTGEWRERVQDNVGAQVYE